MKTAKHLAWALAVASIASAAGARTGAAGEGPEVVEGRLVLSADWIVDEADNVCGLTEARQITNPAKVEYDGLIRATAEIKELERKGIDKDSPEGQMLYNKAVDRVRKASQKVMKAKRYCSVWKSISHRDPNHKIDDITEAVKAKLDEGGETQRGLNARTPREGLGPR